MKKHIGRTILLLLSLGCLIWTWLALLVYTGSWISVPYMILSVLSIVFFILSTVKEKKQFSTVWKILAFIPIIIALGLLIKIIADFAVMYFQTLSSLFLSY